MKKLAKDTASVNVHTQIQRELKRVLPDITAHSWQLNIGEAVSLGLDSVLVARTGAGKTLPFIMPLLAHNNPNKLQEKKKIIIISPLNVLQEDQVSIHLIL